MYIERAKIGRWLDHTSRSARNCERHLAADRAVAALKNHPDLATLVREAILAGDPIEQGKVNQ